LRRALTLLAAGLTACDAPPPQGGGAVVDSPREDLPGAAQPASDEAPLSPRELLIRLSLDLRGTRPRPEEYAALAAAEDADAALEALREELLASPAFPRRVRDLWAPVLRTRTDTQPVGAPELGVAPEDAAALSARIGEEPLMLLSHLAASDLPLTLLVTADHTFADPTLLRVWPLAPGEAATAAGTGDDGWVAARYTDGRPHAGWLSMNGLWWRYLSDGASEGRGRANALARILLCADFLERPVDFPRDVDLTDEAAVRDAVREDPACVGCHASLDPFASFLSGFQYAAPTAGELSRYHLERERDWRARGGPAPAFYGVPGHSLGDLGRLIAGDPRFVSCLTERAFGLLLGPHDPSDASDLDALTWHRESLLAGGVTLKALVRSLLEDPRYASRARERRLTPDQWSEVLFDLTGWRSEVVGRDLFATDAGGLRTLAGGSDGRTGSPAPARATVPMLLAWERSAEAAALQAVAREEPALFGSADLDHDPAGAASGDPVLREAVESLQRRLHGEARAEATDALLGLWDDARTIERAPRRAWAVVLTAALLDPLILTY
jgi:hypothetical protein